MNFSQLTKNLTEQLTLEEKKIMEYILLHLQ